MGLHRRRVDTVVLSMGAQKADMYAKELVFHGDDEAIPVPSNVKNHAIVRNEVRGSIPRSHVSGPLPRGVFDLLEPGSQRLLRVRILPPKSFEC